MNGFATSTFNIVYAEGDSMGGLVEGGIAVADDNPPQKQAIERVKTELRQKYSVRDETKRELEFLVKGGNLLEYKLPHVASFGLHSASISDRQNNQLIAQERKGDFVSATSSHGDSLESIGGPGVAPIEANSANSLMVDVNTQFCEPVHSLSNSCSSDAVPLGRSIQVNRTQKHVNSVGIDLPRKAYKRRNRSHKSHNAAKSVVADVDPAQSGHATLPSFHGSRDGQGLECEVGKLHSIGPSKSTVGGTSGILHRYDFDASKLNETVESTSGCAPRPCDADLPSSGNSLDEKMMEEMQSDANKSPKRMGFSGPEEIPVIDRGFPSVADHQFASTSGKVDNEMIAREVRAFKIQSKDEEESNDVAQGSSFSPNIEGLGSKSICPETGQCNDGNNASQMQSLDSSNINKNEIPTGSCCRSDAMETEKSCLLKVDNEDFNQSRLENGSLPDSDKDLTHSESDSKNKVPKTPMAEEMAIADPKHSTIEKNHAETCVACPEIQDQISCINSQDSIDTKNSDLQPATLSSVVSASGTDSALANIIDEDSVLKEAQIIEAKRHRIAQLSVFTSMPERRWKSQWDFMLEEMAWMSNDFAQERMWKVVASAQISHAAADACQKRREKNLCMDAKMVAHALAKAVLDFWSSIKCTNEVNVQKRDAPIRAYAARFSHRPSTLFRHDDISVKSDRESDLGFQDLPENIMKNENIFYTASPAATETYKKSLLSHVAEIERFGSYKQEEAEMSGCDVLNGFESEDNAYGEDEEETNSFNMPFAYEGSNSARYRRKKKHLKRRHSIGLSDVDSDSLPFQHPGFKIVNQQSVSLAKRPGSTLNALVLTKRVRTASRKIISPFGLGLSGSFQLPTKADASSCDTGSFQDDQSTLYGGLNFPSTSEVQSARDFEKQRPFKSTEISVIPKKKKAKHMNSAYDQRWEGDSSYHEDQLEYVKKRLKNHREFNGDTGLFGQPTVKKPKVLQKSRDEFSDDLPRLGSIPSPVASQLSDMRNTSKFVKILGGRHRGRKVKGPKMPSEQAGSPWSLFDDQALVVLVHDLGPNWELVSDALNSMFHFKCAFRNAKECNERHYNLMDRSSGDGADSAEDSGSSQPYPSGLPGIPKGSARQLFQCLQEPMEEDILKSHFEKMIMIRQKQSLRRSQDPKQLQQPHSSHSKALSQVCPNNLNGSILTPLDLCDSPDAPPNGIQGPHAVGLAGNVGMTKALVPPSGVSSVLQGPPSTMPGNNFAPSPGPVNSSPRDGRHAVPRSADEQKKIQQYNQMMPGRNMPQASLPPHGALSGNAVSSAMGVVHNANRSLLMASPGSISGTPNMLSGVVGTPVPRSRDAMQLIQPGVNDSSMQMMMSDLQMRGNSQGMPQFGGLNSHTTPMPSYALHQIPFPVSPQQHQALNSQHHQFQAQANHALSPQAYAIRFAKERHRQQLMLQQQQPQAQQQFSAPNTPMPHVQAQQQLSMPSPAHSTLHAQPPNSSPVPLSPLLPSSSMNSVPRQLKGQAPAMGVVPNAQAGGSALASHVGKQNYRHHFPQSTGPNSQQQVKASKGASRGNMTLHQKTPTDTSVLNGVSQLAAQNQKLESESQSLVPHRVQPNHRISSSKMQSIETEVHQHSSGGSAAVDAAKSLPLVGKQTANSVQATSQSNPQPRHTSDLLPDANAPKLLQQQQPQIKLDSPLSQSVQAQQQAQLHQAVTGSLYERSNDPR